MLRKHFLFPSAVVRASALTRGLPVSGHEARAWYLYEVHWIRTQLVTELTIKILSASQGCGSNKTSGEKALKATCAPVRATRPAGWPQQAQGRKAHILGDLGLCTVPRPPRAYPSPPQCTFKQATQSG